MISNTIFAIQINLFVKWMTQNTLFFGIYGDGWKIATYGHCTSWMLYIYTIKQFYSFCENMHYIKLCQVVLYLFQINVLRHNHLHYHQDHLWYLFQDLDYLTWACALLANSNNCIFMIFIQSDISNVISNALLGTSQSQSGFNNGNILQIMFASVTPIGPPEKCKVAAYQYKQFF